MKNVQWAKNGESHCGCVTNGGDGKEKEVMVAWGVVRWDVLCHGIAKVGLCHGVDGCDPPIGWEEQGAALGN